MKIALVSDIHLEFYTPESVRPLLAQRVLPETGDARDDFDVLVLAGDITTKSRAEHDLRAISEHFDCPILYVLGNHETWQADEGRISSDDLVAYYRDVCASLRADSHFIHLLERDTVKLGDTKFAGTTLWYPIKRTRLANAPFPDLRRVTGGADWIQEQAEKAQAFLREAAHPSTVVVTHHAPSYESTPPRFIGDPWNVFFVHPVESIIEERMPPLWLHGHMHDPADYRLHQTRVVCNPFGYPGESDAGRHNPLLRLSEGGKIPCHCASQDANCAYCWGF